MTPANLMRDQVRVLSIAEGFFESSVLFALLKLQAFERLGDATKSVEDLAEGAERGRRTTCPCPPRRCRDQGARLGRRRAFQGVTDLPQCPVAVG